MCIKLVTIIIKKILFPNIINLRIYLSKIRSFNLKFKNPVLTAAGPTSHDAAALNEAIVGGVGGVVCDNELLVSNPNNIININVFIFITIFPL